MIRILKRINGIDIFVGFVSPKNNENEDLLKTRISSLFDIPIESIVLEEEESLILV